MEAMFSGRHYVETADGAVVLDRDPIIFKHVLSVLKNNELNLSKSDKKLVDIELEYWGFPPLGYKEKLQELQNILNSEPSDHADAAPLALWK